MLVKILKTDTIDLKKLANTRNILIVNVKSTDYTIRVSSITGL